MTLSTDDSKSAGCLHFIRKLDIGTTTGHIGGDGHRSRLSGMPYDFRLTGMLLGIEDLVVYAAQTKHTAEEL